MTQTIRERRGQIAVTVASRHIWSFALARLLAAYCWLYSRPICLPTNRMCAFMIGQFFVQPNALLAILHLEQCRHWWQTKFVSNLPITISQKVFLNYQVNSNFCLFGVNVLGSRCSLFSRFSLFDFPGLCFKVETDKILFTAKHHRLVFGLFWVHLQPVAR